MFKFKGIPFGMRSAINTDFLGVIYEPKSIPPMYQVRVGPLWATLTGNKLTVWWKQTRVIMSDMMVKGSDL